MVYQVVTATFAPGKGAEAWEWLVKVAAYSNEHFPEAQVQILRNINGPANQGHWVQSYESLAAMEELSVKEAADSDFQELFAQGLGLFEGRVDNFYRTVP